MGARVGIGVAGRTVGSGAAVAVIVVAGMVAVGVSVAVGAAPLQAINPKDKSVTPAVRRNFAAWPGFQILKITGL